MKVIKIDNFNRDDHDEYLVCENISEYYGKIIVELLNDNYSGDHSPYFYVLKENNYKLFKWEP